MTPESSGANDSNVSARRLRIRLKELRLRAGKTQRDVADATYWSPSKVIRIEAGSVRVTVTDCEALLKLYAAAQEEHDELVELCRQARVPSEWSRYSSVVAQETIILASMEPNASTISSFEPFLIPGLLQTEDYARVILSFIRGPKNAERINGIIEMRTERQTSLLRSDAGRRLNFIVDESVVRRTVGGREVMRKQLQRLQQLISDGIIDLLIVPFSTGMYRSLRVPYVVLEFKDPNDDDVLYLEYPDRERIIRAADVKSGESEPTAPSTYLEIFGELEGDTSSERSAAILADALAALDRPYRGSSDSGGARQYLTEGSHDASGGEPAPEDDDDTA